MVRVGLLLVAVLIAVLVIVIIVGYALPRDHTATRAATLKASPESIFAVLQDVEQYPVWRSDLRSVEVLARPPAATWREHGPHGTITFRTVEAHVPARLVTKIDDPTLPFGGRWIYQLSANGRETTLTIVEEGEVYNPLFRFMSRFVFGHTATIDRFLADLERHLSKAASG